MTELVEINEQNWQEFAALHILPEQEGYLDSPLGILARGYACRAQNARVFGIAAEVCVDRTNAAALRLFQGAGFADTGSLDPGCPGCLCLRYGLSGSTGQP